MLLLYYIILLTFPGLPSTPLNLHPVSSQPLQISVMWDPVPALPGEKVSYRVEVTNLADNTSFYKNTSETSYMSSYEDSSTSSSCDEFQFRVQAENEAGFSEFSAAVQMAFPTCKTYCNATSDVVVMVHGYVPSMYLTSACLHDCCFNSRMLSMQ